MKIGTTSFKAGSVDGELALQALAGSLSVAMVYHAAARGYSLRRVRSKFIGEIDMKGQVRLVADNENNPQRISVDVELEGDFTEQQKAEIRQLGTAFSPLFDILCNASPIEVNIVRADRA